MQVMTKPTPSFFIWATCAERSAWPNCRLLSWKTIFVPALAYFLNDLMSPSRHDADCGTLYASTAAFLAPTSLANHGRPGPEQPRHSAPSFGKKLVGPAHSALMFQPNVGMFSCASTSAPVNSSAATNVAKTLSCATVAWACCRLLPALSSRTLTTFNWRP